MGKGMVEAMLEAKRSGLLKPTAAEMKDGLVVRRNGWRFYWSVRRGVYEIRGDDEGREHEGDSYTRFSDAWEQWQSWSRNQRPALSGPSAAKGEAQEGRTRYFVTVSVEVEGPAQHSRAVEKYVQALAGEYLVGAEMDEVKPVLAIVGAGVTAVRVGEGEGRRVGPG